MPDRADHLVSPPRPTRSQAGLVLALSVALLAALIATAPYARIATRGTEVIVPAYAAATFVLETITCALLFALYNVQRSPAVLILACGYLFTALTIPLWVLSFPGVFAALGLEFGGQVTATVAAIRRVGFPLFVLGYALAPVAGSGRRRAGGVVLGSILAVCAVAGLALGLVLAWSDALPRFMRDAHNVTDLWRHVPATALVLYGAAMAILLARRRTALDIWVCLVLFSLVIELLLLSYLSAGARLSLGWWAGRLYGLAAASIVLLVLVSETTSVYARLARTTAAERRARANRLTAMEALSASIAHEINQPLASMITNADAGVRWLAKGEPHIDKAAAALRRIVDDGHRASKVVSGIRTMFMKGAQERMPIDLNALVHDALRGVEPEARLERVAIGAHLAADLPPVIGNAVQLRQVLSNLLENAVDAIRAAGDRHGSLIVHTCRQPFDEVRVSIADTGTGIAPDVAERIFDPFVSTKASGMGMGLMFCRSVVEAHGGRLWTTANSPRGAIFHFSLPAAILSPGSPETLS